MSKANDAMVTDSVERRGTVKAPAPAALRWDGYERSAPEPGVHGEDCSCAACDTHRTFHALLRGSEPKPKKLGGPARRRPDWVSGAEERPPLRPAAKSAQLPRAETH